MFRLQTATSKLIFINSVIYLITIFISGLLYKYFALHTFGNWLFSPIQLVTYQFLHSLNPSHIAFNMLLLYIFAQDLEKIYGHRGIILLYLLSGIGAGILHNLTLNNDLIFVANIIHEDLTLVGASGSVWGILAVWALSLPKQRVHLLFTSVSFEMRWVILFYFLTELLSVIVVDYTDETSHFAHIGGAISGLLFYLYKTYMRKTS